MFKLHFLFAGISADPAYDGAPGEKGREGKEGPKGAQSILNHFIDLQINSKHLNILTEMFGRSMRTVHMSTTKARAC